MEVAELVRLAASGERAAWEALVERHEALLWGIARSHRLDLESASDVVQTTWLKLLEHVDDLRNPTPSAAGLRRRRATSACACCASSRARSRPRTTASNSVPSSLDAQLLAKERDAALWRAFSRPSARCQALLRTLASDPAPSYDAVSAALDMPVGSIGPTRGRCLATLRRLIAGTRITSASPDS
jgi:DNA-directed RNA polymerase specialized sigma24 family protein